MANQKTQPGPTASQDKYVDKASPEIFLDPPAVLYAKITKVKNGAHCTEAIPCNCTNANVTKLPLRYLTTGSWNGVLNPGAGVGELYKFVSLTIIADASGNDVVTFTIRKAGGGAAVLVTYANSAWNGQFPINLTKSSDNGMCNWTDATVNILNA